MDTKELLTIASWPVTFCMGILSGFVVSRLTRKRQIMTWAAIGEADLVPRELTNRLGLPVSLKVGDATPSSLTALTIRIGNSGNEAIKDVPVLIRLNDNATILNIRITDEDSEYGKQLKKIMNGSRCTISPPFINPSQTFELDILVSDYESGTIDVDAAAAGLELRRTSASVWDQVLQGQSGLIKGLKLSVPGLGIGYDSGAAALSIVAEELRALRRAESKKLDLHKSQTQKAVADSGN